MSRKLFLGIFCLMFFSQISIGQVTTKKVEGVSVSSSKAILLGKSKPVRELISKPVTSKEKRQSKKIQKQVPDNFKGRLNKSSAVHLDKEHQGPDPVRQWSINKRMDKEIELLANVQGLGQGSPTDPSGDVNSEFYVQAVNATQVGVYNQDGTLEAAFALNTIFAPFNVASFGDPIVLYDEVAERWFLTEFTGPANLLVAVSETDDPLGSYFIFNFSTPFFPDYPKYAITQDYLILTTNEQGRTNLHQYFFDKSALLSGAEEVDFQRVRVDGTNGNEQTFYVSTPVDLNGPNAPFDSRPITMRLNDSSWGGGPAQDQIEMYRFIIDFDNPDNTEIEQTSIVTAPFDAFPCSATGAGFACIPQFNGTGLDGIPELVMNLPHQRNFGTHESLVYSHITDATNGQNVAGIRWVELRRTAETDWSVYQQGTFAPDDGLERFMSTAAIDSRGNICLGYNVSSSSSFAGIRATGRNADDPLGEMTFTEIVLAEGQRTINSGGRFGDYSQMSVPPGGVSEFWFTAEYSGSTGVVTNIARMSLQRDSFDLGITSFISPAAASADLTNSENVTIEIFNGGINTIETYDIALEFEGTQVDMISITDPIAPNESVQHTFSADLDLSNIQDYNLTATVSAPLDQNPINNTLSTIITNLPPLEAGLSGTLTAIGCAPNIIGSLTLTNLGGDNITSATVGITVNGVAQPNLNFNGSLAFEETNTFDININQNLVIGDNEVTASIISVNNETADSNASNNELTFNTEALDGSEFVIVRFLTDRFPEESSYNIVDANGVTIAEELNFTEESTIHDEMVCIAEGDCVTFTLFDSYGDGICCGGGIGNITILDRNGNVIAFNAGIFGAELIIDFCNVTEQCTLNAEIDFTESTSPVSNDGTIFITALNGIGPFEYSINGGQNFQSGSVFNNLAPDDYEVIVRDITSGCEFIENVTIESGTVATYTVGDASVNVDLIPNPTDGLFQIKVRDLPTNEIQLDIEIYDIQGKLLQNRKIGKWDNEFLGTFSLYAYPAGTYLVRVKSGENNFLERIVKH